MDIQNLLTELTVEEKAALLAGTDFMYTNPVPRLGIKSVRMSDGPHGLRVQSEGGDNGVSGSEPATAFPTAVTTASGWNPENTYKMGKAIGEEALHYGIDVLLGPGACIKRNPLCGRNFEYFSEDPYLAGKMGAAEVNGVQSQGVGVSVKHFALNNAENFRFMGDSICDVRAINVTVAGFVFYAVGSAICWMVPTNLIVVIIGQFIKNIGGLPCAYIFMSLFSDSFDHLEWKTGFRSDSLAMSIYSTITIVLMGVGLAILNAALNASGYIPPLNVTDLGEAEAILAQNGWLSQLDLSSYKMAIDGTFTVGIQQPGSTLNAISFLFVGLEVITGILSAILLAFIGVEKTLERKQKIIRERQKEACEKSGKVWVEPEVQLEMDQQLTDEEAEEIFRSELKSKCEKKGLNYEEELEKHIRLISEKNAKEAEKKRLAEEKQAAKLKAAEEKQTAKLAKLTPKQLVAREEKARRRRERIDAAWAIELEKGNATYQKMQDLLKKYAEKKEKH